MRRAGRYSLVQVVLTTSAESSLQTRGCRIISELTNHHTSSTLGTNAPLFLPSRLLASSRLLPCPQRPPSTHHRESLVSSRLSRSYITAPSWTQNARALSSTSSSPSSASTSTSLPSSPASAQGALEDDTQTTTQQTKPAQGKIKAFIRRYGPVGVCTYLGIYGVTLAGFYTAFQSGLLREGDIESLIDYLGLATYIDVSGLNPRLSSFALAWIVTKFTEPIRAALTVAVTPFIVRKIKGAPTSAPASPSNTNAAPASTTGFPNPRQEPHTQPKNPS
jgi:hypothetical protein